MSATKHVVVDEEVFTELKKRSRESGSRNAVLRKLLGMPARHYPRGRLSHKDFRKSLASAG
jgi:predicted CopG family antitoxin